jgi:hypothetical protein
MSIRGLYQIADGTFVRTQGEIPKGQPVNKVEVPIDSKGLCDYLNRLIYIERGPFTAPMPTPVVAEPQEDVREPVPSAPVAPVPDAAALRRKLAQEIKGMEVEAIEERILDMKAAPLGRIMAASVERFGALGKDAWDSLRGFLDLHSAAANNYDRGLHLLSLHQIERMSEPKPEPKTYKELNG